MGAALAAMVMMVSLAACGGEADNYNLECDRGDQSEYDSDCGYNADGQWVWFSWVKIGQDSHSPDGWQPPSGVSVEQDEEGSHTKVKKIKKKSKAKR